MCMRVVSIIPAPIFDEQLVSCGQHRSANQAITQPDGRGWLPLYHTHGDRAEGTGSLCLWKWIEWEAFGLFKLPRGPDWRLLQWCLPTIILRAYLERPAYHQHT